MILRDYQQNAVSEVQSAFQTAQGVFLTLPTGGGKTVIFSAIAQAWVDAGLRVLILAHRRELLNQAAGKLKAFGLDAGIIQGKRNTNPSAPVQVASIDTLRNRELPWMPDLIIVDEAHLSAARRFQVVLERFPMAKRLLVSATPYRYDGKGFRGFADELIIGVTVSELIDAGHLVNPRYLTGELPPGLDRVRTERGDFAAGELEAVINVRSLRADIVSTFAQHAADRKAVVFACSVSHSKALTLEFNQAGFKAEHLDGSMDDTERSGILARLESGETQIVSNANILCEGWDCPSISAVVLARPTKSESLYVQQVGRVLRTSPGKVDGLVLDHGGNHSRHGSILIPRSYTLDGVEKKTRGERQKRTVCIKCNRLLQPNGRCSWCYVPQVLQVEYVTGELFTPEEHPMTGEIIQRYQTLLTLAATKKTKAGKSYSRSWAFYKMLERGYTEETLISVLGMREMPYMLKRERGLV